jgi:hypothetical protein
VRRRLLRPSAALLVVLAVLALTACGSDEQAKSDCRDEAYNAAEAAAVSRAYDAGELGTRKQVETELSGPPGGGASFFDESGRLIPYRRLDLHHKIQFIAWMTNGRVATITEEERARARAATEPDC